MPGKGKAEPREYSDEERAEIELYVRKSDLRIAEALELLGQTTYDIYLNQNVILENVPARVWHYHIGGYQALKKWLSFREQKVLGRAITLDELREATKITRRIAVLLLLGSTLDLNYSQISLTHNF